MRGSLSARSLALLGVGLAAALAPLATAAEGFFDARMGAVFPEDGHVDARAVTPGFSSRYSGGIAYDTTFTTGVRGGYWFEDATNFLGVGLDLSYYGAFEDTSTAPLDIIAFPMSPLLMVRLPLGASDEMPGGPVQPYAAIGPAFTISAAFADLSELGLGLDDFRDASFDVGLDVRGGLAIQVARSIALFAEYRYTYLRPSFDDKVDAIGPDVDIDIDPDLDAHHLTFGVSFRF